MNLMNLLLSTLTSTQSVDSVAKKTGLSSSKVKLLLMIAVPILIKAMKNNASSKEGALSLLGALSGLSILGGLVYDVVAVFGELQAEGGEFDITGLASVHWLSVIIVSAACSIVAFVLMLISVRLSKKEK